MIFIHLFFGVHFLGLFDIAIKAHFMLNILRILFILKLVSTFTQASWEHFFIEYFWDKILNADSFYFVLQHFNDLVGLTKHYKGLFSLISAFTL